MKMQSRSPLWPYLGILICLFVFSLIAPKAWQPHAIGEVHDYRRASRYEV